ncbi:MAG: flagellar protein FlaG [Gammaproteobacteria bacterium]|nr:flagellar protein FlaG [Gammaproteobacteria bacterium]
MDALTLNSQLQVATQAKGPAQPKVAAAESGKVSPESGKAAPPPAPEIDIPEIDIEQAVAQIQEFIVQSERDLDFRVDDATGRTVISVYGGSGELIRQYPSEEILKIAANLQQQGLQLIDQSA